MKFPCNEIHKHLFLIILKPYEHTENANQGSKHLRITVILNTVTRVCPFLSMTSY